MPEWFVKIRIVEIGRVVRIEAPSRREARRLARRAEWLECSDAPEHLVSVVGKVEVAT